MKYQIMLEILFTLLAKRKVSAGELAKDCGVSVRTIHRYVDEMTIAGVPIDISRGVNGGFYISDAYKLPKGLMTKAEYVQAIQAMLAMNEQLKDPVLESAIRKLSAQLKSEKYNLTLSGNILVDSGTWGDTNRFSEKLSLVEQCIEEKTALDIDYISRQGERTQRRIQPYLLVYKQNIWYVYAYCTLREEFRLFKLGRMRSLIKTEEQFTPKPFRRADVPLQFWHEAGKNTVYARFEVAPDGLPSVQDWLGVENVQSIGGRYIAEVELPDDESLVGKILSVGPCLKVLSPAFLKKRVKTAAQHILESYNLDDTD